MLSRKGLKLATDACCSKLTFASQLALCPEPCGSGNAESSLIFRAVFTA